MTNLILSFISDGELFCWSGMGIERTKYCTYIIRFSCSKQLKFMLTEVLRYCRYIMCEGIMYISNSFSHHQHVFWYPQYPYFAFLHINILFFFHILGSSWSGKYIKRIGSSFFLPHLYLHSPQIHNLQMCVQN